MTTINFELYRLTPMFAVIRETKLRFYGPHSKLWGTPGVRESRVAVRE